MNNYRFSGRVASYFRATGNAWASARTVAETVGGDLKAVKNECHNLLNFGHLERRGQPRSYEYRWDPETLHQGVRP